MPHCIRRAPRKQDAAVEIHSDRWKRNPKPVKLKEKLSEVASHLCHPSRASTYTERSPTIGRRRRRPGQGHRKSKTSTNPASGAMQREGYQQQGGRREATTTDLAESSASAHESEFAQLSILLPTQTNNIISSEPPKRGVK